jgi:hypothetical protein
MLITSIILRSYILVFKNTELIFFSVKALFYTLLNRVKNILFVEVTNPSPSAIKF